MVCPDRGAAGEGYSRWLLTGAGRKKDVWLKPSIPPCTIRDLNQLNATSSELHFVTCQSCEVPLRPCERSRQPSSVGEGAAWSSGYDTHSRMRRCFEGESWTACTFTAYRANGWPARKRVELQPPRADCGVCGPPLIKVPHIRRHRRRV
eukprot:3023942-Prymnesium_polylepis.2